MAGGWPAWAIVEKTLDFRGFFHFGIVDIGHGICHVVLRIAARTEACTLWYSPPQGVLRKELGA